MDDITFEQTLEITREKVLGIPDEKFENLSQEEIVEIICSGCPFYKPDKEYMECGAFRILSSLLKKGVLKKEDLLKI